MKKVLVGIMITLCIFSFGYVYADGNEVLEKNNETEEVKDVVSTELNTIKDYQKKYNSEVNGVIAYGLNKARIYIIPIGFVLIVIALFMQFGTSLKRSTEEKGIKNVIPIIVVILAFQVFPFIFLIIAKGWGE